MIFYLFIFEHKKLNGDKESSKILDKIKNLYSLDYLDELINDSLNFIPYYIAIRNIDIPGMNYYDYDKFFKYNYLVDICTGLYTLKHLNGKMISGSIGTIKDNLNCFFNYFLFNEFDKKDKELFSFFEDLNNKFKYLEDY